MHPVRGHQPHTRGGLPQELLQPGRQADNVVGGPGPKDEAVSLVPEARLDVRTLQPQDCLVDGEALEVGGEEPGLLLGVSAGSVGRVEPLDFLRVMVASIDQGRVGILARLEGSAREVLQLVAGIRCRHGHDEGWRGLDGGR